MPIPWAGQPAGRWPGHRSPTITCRSSTPTCSSWATRRWASSIPVSKIVPDWQELYRKGVVYYLEAGRVRGVLLWNVWDQVDAARAIIGEPGPFQPADLRGRLPH